MAASTALTIRRTMVNGVLFEDGSNTQWLGLIVDGMPKYVLTCNCVVARKVIDPARQSCKHITQVMFKGLDRFAFEDKDSTISIQVAPATKHGATPIPAMFIDVHLMKTDPQTKLREIWWEDNHLGYMVHGAELGRWAIRDMLWPFLLQTATGAHCAGCVYPPAIGALVPGCTSVEQYAAIRVLLFINQSGDKKCPDCDMSALMISPF